MSSTAQSSAKHIFPITSGRIILCVLIFGVATEAFVIYRVLYRLLLYPYFRSPLRSVPGPPLGHPVYGQVFTILDGEAGIPQRQWVKEYGPVVRVVGPIGIERLIFTNPEALHKILVSDWTEYPRPKFMRDILGITAGYGLLTVTGNEHRQMRKAMNPAFSIPNLMAQTDMYYESIDSLVEILRSQIRAEPSPESGKVFLAYEWKVSKVTLDIICKTAFGYTTDSLHSPHNELAEAYEELLNLQTGTNLARFIALMFIPGFPWLMTSEWAYKHRHLFSKIKLLAPAAVMINSMHRIKQISAAMLSEKMRDSAVKPSDIEAKRDIMSLLVRYRQTERDNGATGYAMDDEAIMNQVLTFLGAGHETTASGLAWTLWLLAKDTESQTRLRNELKPIFEANSRPDYRHLNDLQWLDCIIMESLRLMPPVPMTFRITDKADFLDGIYVPKGTLLYIPIRVVNTWTMLWGEDAEEFKPSRWLNLPKNYNRNFSVLSFIAGPHACIGKTMAIMEMKAVLASLISNFEFEPAYDGQKPQPTAAVTMKPKDSMPLRLRCVQRMP